MDLKVSVFLTFLAGKLEGTEAIKRSLLCDQKLPPPSLSAFQTHTDTLRTVLVQRVKVSARAKHGHSAGSQHGPTLLHGFQENLGENSECKDCLVGVLSKKRQTERQLTATLLVYGLRNRNNSDKDNRLEEQDGVIMCVCVCCSGHACAGLVHMEARG